MPEEIVAGAPLTDFERAHTEIAAQVGRARPSSVHTDILAQRQFRQQDVDCFQC